MILQLPTLLVVAGILALFLGTGFLALPSIRRREPAFLYWGVANLVVAAASLLAALAVVRAIPIDVAAVLAPCALLSGAVIFYAGVRVFDRCEPLLRPHAVVIALVLSLLVLFTTVHDSAQARVVTVSAFSAAYGIIAVRHLLRGGDGRAGRLLLAGAWGGHALFGLLRAVVTLLDDPGRHAVDAGGVHTAAGLVLVLVVVLFNGAGLIMMAGRLTAALERLAHFDTLTGTLTRGAFMSRASRMLERSARDGASVGVLVFDLDHFKAVNDRFGHPAGDAVLRSVADAVRDALRPSDLLGRMGGEEFAVILAESPPDGTRDVAERLRWTVAATDARAGRHTVRVTVSVGFVVAPAGGDSVEGLLARADAALYAAKAAGRDRVCAAEPVTDAASPPLQPGSGTGALVSTPEVV